MQASVIQMNSGADVAANLDQARTLLERAAAAGARLAALPENFALMGAHDTDKLAIAEADGDGPIQAFVAGQARRLGLWIVAGTLPLAVPGDPSHVYASCCVYADSGARVARYDKIHLFDVEVPDRQGEHYRESASIAPGAAQPVVIDTPLGRLGLSVCYDLRFPELFRALQAQGAELFCVPAAFTAATGAAHWQMLLRARAVESLCHVLAPGQCGEHPGGRRTWGHSLIVDPWGAVQVEADAVTPQCVTAALDIGYRTGVRERFPVLRHRRL